MLMQLAVNTYLCSMMALQTSCKSSIALEIHLDLLIAALTRLG